MIVEMLNDIYHHATLYNVFVLTANNSVTIVLDVM